MNPSKLLLLAVVAFVLASIESTQAVLIASEEFDYSLAPFNRANNSSLGGIPSLTGGTGWANAWAGNAYYQTTGMTQTGLVVAGGAVQTRTFNDTSNFRTISTVGHESITTGGLFGNDGTTIWIRFLESRLNSGDGTTGFAGISLFNGASTETLFMGKPNNAATWGFAKTTEHLSAVSVASQVLYIAKIDFASGNDTVSMWAYTGAAPASESGLGAAMATASVPTFQFDRIRIGTDKQYNFDEIYIGTDYSSMAVPEPATWAMLAFSLTTIVVFRRRRPA